MKKWLGFDMVYGDGSCASALPAVLTSAVGRVVGLLGKRPVFPMEKPGLWLSPAPIISSGCLFIRKINSKRGFGWEV